MLFDPLCYFWEMFVLLTDVVLFTEIDKVNDWFGGEEEERIYDFNLCPKPYL